MAKWFTEVYSGNWGLTIEVDKWLYRGETPYQKVEIFENATLGRVLALDGIIQTTEADEFIYHEMLAHVPILAHGAVENVLIIGGGDGSMLRHALMHPGLQQVTMVDIDPDVVQLCRQYLPKHNAGAFEHEKANYIAGDGLTFVRDTLDRFDVIIVDSTDPTGGPGDQLFSRKFYQDCKGCLSPGGIITLQSGMPSVEPDRMRKLKQTFGSVFDDFAVYLATVPTYYGGVMACGWGSDDKAYRALSRKTLKQRFANSGLRTQYYTPELHQAAFVLPKFIQDLVN